MDDNDAIINPHEGDDRFHTDGRRFRYKRGRRDGRIAVRLTTPQVVKEPTAAQTARREARLEILAAAEKACRLSWRKFHLKNINEAVYIVRHHGSVEAETLVAAGFNVQPTNARRKSSGK